MATPEKTCPTREEYMEITKQTRCADRCSGTKTCEQCYEEFCESLRGFAKWEAQLPESQRRPVVPSKGISLNPAISDEVRRELNIAKTDLATIAIYGENNEICNANAMAVLEGLYHIEELLRKA